MAIFCNTQVRGLAYCLIYISCVSGAVRSKKNNVLVYRFQENEPQSNSYILYAGQIASSRRPMNSASFCTRINLHFLWDITGFLELSDTSTGEKQVKINAEIHFDYIRVRFGEFRQYLYAQIHLKTFTWYHLCVTYGDRVITSYLDGVKMAHAILPRPITPITANTLKIGSYTAEESFNGMITHIGIWNRVLSASEILQLSLCDDNPEYSKGNLISWNGPWTIEGDVTHSNNVSLWELCNKKIEDIFVFPNISATDSFHICNGIGGYLPIPETRKELLTFQKRLFTKHNNFNYEVVWAGITDLMSENMWIDPINKRLISPYWQENEPDGGHIQNCGGIRINKGVGDFECSWNRCAVCLLNKRPILTLYGVCERMKINTLYAAIQTEFGNISFRGYSRYIIDQDSNGTWIWQDWRNDIIIAHLPHPYKNLPLGRQKWTLDIPMCGQGVGETRELLFTACDNGKFTCDCGNCVPIKQRCDLKLDCDDGSDERNCVLIDIPDTYRQDISPVGNPKDLTIPLNVKYNIFIESIDINTRMMQMHVNFRSVKIWYDSRLKFLNLNEEVHLNQVPKTVQTQLWSPMIDFLNTKGVQITRVDEKALLWISRQGQPKLGDISRPKEVEIYSGSENPISVAQKNSINFQCHFDLRRYPFDEQKCTMELIIVSANSQLVQFDEMLSGVQFEPEGTLMEYTVERVEQTFDKTHAGFRCMQVTVYLRRRSGHILLNVYVPSILLLCISYLTFFFKIDMFQVRILASITILLVTATIFTQTSSALPKTSYVKLVDVWLLSCIFILVMVIIFHTLIDRFQEISRFTGIGITSPFKRPSYKTDKDNNCNSTAPEDINGFPNRMYDPRASIITIIGCTPAIRRWVGRPAVWPLHERMVMAARSIVLMAIIIQNAIYWSYAF